MVPHRIVRRVAGVAQVAHEHVGGGDFFVVRCDGRERKQLLGNPAFEQHAQAGTVKGRVRWRTCGRVRREPAARDRQRHVAGFGQLRDVVLGRRAREQRGVQAEGMQAKPARRERIAAEQFADPDQRRFRVRVGAQSPEEQADVRDVPTPAARRDATDLDRPHGRLEGRADELQRLRVSQTGEGLTLRPQVIQLLRRRQPLEELDRARGPAGHVAREQFQHWRRPLAPAVGHGMAHLRARGARARARRQPADAEQIAEIRQRPRRGGLDELIVVELFETLFEHGHLARHELDQFAQRAGSPVAGRVGSVGVRQFGVARAEMGGQQVPELVGSEAHGDFTSSCGRDISSRISSSAGSASAAATPSAGWWADR